MIVTLTFLNNVFTLLSAFIEWGKRTKLFKEDEALVALDILTRVQKDIQLAKETRDAVRAELESKPDELRRDDGFFRD